MNQENRVVLQHSMSLNISFTTHVQKSHRKLKLIHRATLRKITCEHEGELICSVYMERFIREIGLNQQGCIYVVCSDSNSEVFKLNTDMKALQRTHNDTGEHLGLAYELLVTSDKVLACSQNQKKICILDYGLNLCYYLDLGFDPCGITHFNGRYFVTARGKIGVIDINFGSKNNYVVTREKMKMNYGTEGFSIG